METLATFVVWAVVIFFGMCLFVALAPLIILAIIFIGIKCEERKDALNLAELAEIQKRQARDISDLATFLDDLKNDDPEGSPDLSLGLDDDDDDDDYWDENFDFEDDDPDGKEDCYNCQGVGVVDNGDACPVCGGEGKV